jgi:general secretion pathway protein D
VSVKDGETAVLGGIIQTSLSTTKNKVPILGDIPLVGNLFRSTTVTKDKTELLVFLTPRIVRSAEEAQKLRERSESELQPGTLDLLKKTRVRTIPTPPAGEKKAGTGEQPAPQDQQPPSQAEHAS